MCAYHLFALPLTTYFFLWNVICQFCFLSQSIFQWVNSIHSYIVWLVHVFYSFHQTLFSVSYCVFLFLNFADLSNYFILLLIYLFCFVLFKYHLNRLLYFYQFLSFLSPSNKFRSIFVYYYLKLKKKKKHLFSPLTNSFFSITFLLATLQWGETLRKPCLNFFITIFSVIV